MLYCLLLPPAFAEFGGVVIFQTQARESADTTDSVHAHTQSEHIQTRWRLTGV